MGASILDQQVRPGNSRRRFTPSRQVEGLVAAQFTDKNPWPKSRRRGAFLEGMRYEKRVVEEVKKRREHGQEVFHGQWINFRDVNGRGFAQPDILVLDAAQKAIWVLEAKYTFVPEGVDQLLGLYVPLVRKIWPGAEVVPVIVCRNVGTHLGMIREYLIEELFDAAWKVPCSHEYHVWHWIG